MIITIDGPAGTGKTTVARRVAECLHFSYFDTGAMYRTVTLWVLENEIPLDDFQSLEKELDHFSFRIEEKGKEKRYFLGDKDVTEAIRSKHITSNVSRVAALAPIRKRLWKIQHAYGEKRDSVFEGRDLGTVVFPNAEIKIFLTARPEVRAQRRLDEILAKNPKEAESMDHDKMLEDLKRRDELDSTRTLAPLKCAEDAYVVDTSDLSIDEVVNQILQYKLEKFS